MGEDYFLLSGNKAVNLWWIFETVLKITDILDSLCNVGCLCICWSFENDLLILKDYSSSPSYQKLTFLGKIPNSRERQIKEQPPEFQEQLSNRKLWIFINLANSFFSQVRRLRPGRMQWLLPSLIFYGLSPLPRFSAKSW